MTIRKIFKKSKSGQEYYKMSGFSFVFTKEQLATLLNNNPETEEWFEAMAEILPKYDITTVERVAGFVAQCAHESNNFRSLEENLNYSEDALNSVFGRYFGPGKRDASEYARNPEKIANYVYMDEYRSARGALGNTEPGDGWRFRGRGLKQLTGRNNYAAFGETVGMSAEEAVEYVKTKPGALESACWFWDKANCNKFADEKDIVGMSKRINGGTIGLEDRKRRWEQALNVLGNESVSKHATVKVGSRGETVKEVQKALGITADGIFGPATESAVKKWQENNGLSADGIVGPKTAERLLNR